MRYAIGRIMLVNQNVIWQPHGENLTTLLMILSLHNFKIKTWTNLAKASKPKRTKKPLEPTYIIPYESLF